MAFDEYTFLWNFWWFRHAIFDLGVNPFYSEYIFIQLASSLVLYTFTLLNAILAIPLEFVFGYAAATNTLVIFSFVAGAYGTFLLTDYLLKETKRFAPVFLAPAALMAGIAFAFTSSRFVYASLGHPNFLSSHFLPFYALFFVKTLRAPRAKHALMAGFFAALAAVSLITIEKK